MRYSGIGRKGWSVVWEVGDGIGALGGMKECLKVLFRRLQIAKEREDLACCLLFTYRFGKKLKILKNNIIDKTAGNQRLTMVCGKVEAYEFLELILIIPIFVNVKYWLDKKCYLMSDKVA